MVKQSFSVIILLIVSFLTICSYTIAQNDTINVINDSTVILPDLKNIQIDSTELKIDTIQNLKKTEPIVIEEIDSLSVMYFSGSIDKLKRDQFQYIDTNTFSFQQFDPINFKNGTYSTLSNIGLAHKNQIFTPDITIDYYFNNQSFPKYIYENQKVKYYKLYMPYTEATYVFGSKKEQNFQIVFNREIIKRLTIGIDFALNNSPGPYTNSKADDKRVFFTGQYYSKNLRYGVIANYVYNKLIVQENGGIKNDSIFEADLESDRRNIPVNLTNAQNTIKQSGFFVEQYFNLLKPKPDSIQRKLDAGSISWSLQYQRNQMIYESDDTAKLFYLAYNSPLDTEQTFDSVYQMRIRNKFQWSSIGYHDNPLNKVFNIYFGIFYDYIYQSFPDYQNNNSFIYDQLTSLTYNQLKPYGGIGLNIKESFRINGYAEIVLGGYNSGDVRFEAKINQYLGNIKRNFGEINAGIEFVSKTPAWYYQNFQSNFYRWKNNLKKENYLLIFGEYQYKYLKGGVKFFTFGNYTYMNDSIRPEQLTDASTILQVYVEGMATIKKFGLNTKLTYQNSSHPDVIRLPEFSGVIDLFFKSPIFKRAATLQVGFELTYFTKYYADAYMPALRDWYIQNDQQIGNTLFADVYLTLKVKNARLFLKYAHFNGLFSASNYYMAPQYPARDARFYLGVNWKFYN